MAKTKGAKSSANNNKNAKPKEKLKLSHIIISLLASLAFSFSFLIVGPLSFFYSSEENRSFFETNYIYAKDLVPLMIVAALILFAILGAILVLATNKLRKILVSVITWFLVGGYIQIAFFNGWTRGLLGDGNAGAVIPALGIPNLILWLVLAGLIIVLPLNMDKICKKFPKFPKLAKDIISKYLVVYLLVLAFAMQGAGLMEVVLNAPDERKPQAYLSTENMFDISENENVVVFVVDRFDMHYYNQVLKANPDFFDDFDGFTAYTDNIALYARTYPAVTSMLTGVEHDIESTRIDYFKNAYKKSKFLDDMAAGGFDVNVYTSSWYVYDNANDMGTISNAFTTDGPVVLDNPMGLLGSMMSYSFYNSFPDIVKPLLGVSTNSFVGHGSQHTKELDGEAPEQYAIDDAKVYESFKEEGVTVKSKNNFAFIHLRGCHSPYNVDENCEYVGDNASDLVKQTTGVFKFIREYIAELKAAGAYEDATIIITGDHANPVSDKDDVQAPRLTALLVKEKGQSGTALKESKAPVSQANLIPTIIKSTGVKASTDYGKAYSEIGEGDITTRKYLFEKTVDSQDLDEIVEYEIIGPASDYNNWKIKERHIIGKLYK